MHPDSEKESGCSDIKEKGREIEGQMGKRKNWVMKIED